MSLPHREYELAGRLMAEAIAGSAATGDPAVEVLHQIAHDYGRTIGDTAVDEGPADRPTPSQRWQVAAAVLTEHGYQPRRVDSEMQLANCPFHALAQQQTELACGMNHALICGVAEALTPHSPRARLDPQPQRCCVVLTASAARP